MKGEAGIVRRIRIERPKVGRDRSFLDVLPLDPRDPDIVRAKAIDRSGDRRSGTTPVRAPVRDRS